MGEFGYWNPFFENNKFPCYVRDIESEKIMYANEEFYRVFGCDQSVIGHKFNEVVVFDQESYDHIHNNVERHQDYTVSFYYPPTQQNYTAFAHMIRDGKTVFCEFRVLKEEQTDSHFETALTRCLEIYQLPSEKIVPTFMALLGEYYDCGRAYVHTIDYQRNTVNCIAQWNELPTTKTMDRVVCGDEGESIITWINEHKIDGIVSCDFLDDCDVCNAVRDIFLPMNIQNITLCTVEDVNKQTVGVVGISNRRRPQAPFDSRLLTTIARFVAQDVAQGFVEARLFQLHHRDSLTGLFNRTGYAKRIDAVLKENPKSLGVISANVNGLKTVNERDGIAGGDEYIKRAARRIKDHFAFEIFRMSGDEFLGIAPDITKEAFEEKVFSLVSAMKEEENLDFSIGHSWGSGRIDLPKLTFEAETVMYINKQEYYSRSDRKCDSVNDGILADLLRFLENEEFMIYLQPQVRLKDGSLHGAEALIRRFDKANQKMVFPDQFIPMYEQNSVIRHVDMFVVEQVCKLLAQWVKTNQAIPISVNLSRVTLQEYGIVNNIVQICDKYEIPHELLVIEVTERVGLIENNVASSLIMDFKRHGFSISLDDFGCAYSNIVTLAQIEVDEVKVDKSLVDHILTNQKNTVIVESVLSMCNKLDNTSTLAEGIEEEAQAQMLYDLHCELGQGYFYSRPIPVTDFVSGYISASIS